MSANVPIADDDIHVSVDLVPHGLERRRENIAFLRISAMVESRGGGFAIEGFDAGSSLGSTVRTLRIALPDRHSIWKLVANAAYAPSEA